MPLFSKLKIFIFLIFGVLASVVLPFILVIIRSKIILFFGVNSEDLPPANYVQSVAAFIAFLSATIFSSIIYFGNAQKDKEAAQENAFKITSYLSLSIENMKNFQDLTAGLNLRDPPDISNALYNLKLSNEEVELIIKWFRNIEKIRATTNAIRRSAIAGVLNDDSHDDLIKLISKIKSRYGV